MATESNNYLIYINIEESTNLKILKMKGMKNLNILSNKISLEDKETLEKYLRGYRYNTSGMSFSSLYMWRNINEFEWEEINGYMCLVGISHLDLEMGIKKYFATMPLTSTGEYNNKKLKETILTLKERFEAKGENFVMMLIPNPIKEIIAEIFGDGVEIKEDRDNFDYLYEKEKLINLSGRALHKKKNHKNYFLKNFKYEYKPLTSDMAGEAMQFIKAFNKKKDVVDEERYLLELEEKAMKDVFENIEKVGYYAGCIYIDGKMQALSVGGEINDDTVCTHIEKANIDYRGLYQVINSEFCSSLPEYIKYINREEDMGLEGLRKSKTSYKPMTMVEKNILTFKN